MVKALVNAGAVCGGSMHQALVLMVLSVTIMGIASNASAQTAREKDMRVTVKSPVLADASAARHVPGRELHLRSLKTADVSSLVMPPERARWVRASFRSPSDTARARTNGRSKRRSMLIGAAIGGAVGAAAGFYVGEATGGDAHPWAVPTFAGIGAGVGALTGFVVALF
jgi:hypothetical protein